MRGDWRTDPDWRLVEVDEGWAKANGVVFSHTPPPRAELAQPDSWASLYDGGLRVATWSRFATLSGGGSRIGGA